VTRWKLGSLLATGAVLAAIAAGCGGGGGGEETTPPTTGGGTGAVETSGGTETTGGGGGAATGGTYRVDYEASFDFTNNFDPTGEYLGEAFSMYSNLLIRTLVGYRHVAGPPGNELIPDLATDLGQVSDDGLTYTFTLKDGVKFGPPLSRPITSKDIKYAFQRIATKDLVAQYGFYYLGTIKGMQEMYDGKADDISGIETPDDKTIVFHLTEPTGDFLYRLAMPAAGPIPEEVAKCATKPGDYGRFLISSGPYMLEGSDQLDVSSCDAMKPISGYQPDQSITMVRNPDYDPATDTPEARENLIDKFVWTINTNNDDIYNKIAEGLIDDEVASEPAKVLREYSTDDSKKDLLKINSGDRTWYITMNLTQPPFDDIHVRKAVNLVMDKGGLQRAWGGPLVAEIATHIAPDVLLNDTLKGYDPYQTPDEAGDLDAAKAEMKQSKYDSNGDGVCDADVCKNVLHIGGTREVDKNMIPVIEASLEKIGITLKTRTLDDAYTTIQTVSKNVPISSRPGWGKDYADPLTFFDPLFSGSSIIPTGNTNYSLVGLTPEKAQELKGITGTLTGIPSVDADMKACHPLTGDERITCYGNVDKKLMEQVVPWVPYNWSNAVNVIADTVTKWEFDQFGGSIGYAHVAVDPSKQK
jgi:peptide/nickel transport system substrate-binding protein